MRCLLLAALLFGQFLQPAAAYSKIEGLVRYDCDKQLCKFQCRGPETELSRNYQTVTVFQWKLHPRRLWIAVNNEHHVLGDDVTCTFEGKPTFEYDTSPLPPVKPPCTCIGNQCTPPGCRP